MTLHATRGHLTTPRLVFFFAEEAVRTESRDRRAPQVASLNIPVSSNFNLESFLSSDAVIQDWTAKGLPADEHSVQNGILTTAASRFPLCIDPQQQAVSWIKNMYGQDQLKLKSLSESDFMKHLELAIQFGAPFLFENVDEELDPMLDPARARRLEVLWVVSFSLKRPFGPRRATATRRAGPREKYLCGVGPEID